MSWQDLPIDFFMERLLDMPDVEAIEEIDTRMQRIKEDRKGLGDAKGATETRMALNLEEDQLRLRRAKLVDRTESRKWSKAVRAIYGQEGLEKCLEWMRGSPEDSVKSVALRRSNEKAH